MEHKGGSGTVEKALDVLFYLSGSADPQGVTAIAQALEMPKSSTHRLLTTLARRNLIEQDGHGRYHVGIALIALGLGAQEREPVVVAARPILEAAAAEVGETFFLVIARAGQLVVLDKAEGNGFLRAAPQIGSTVPVHATAVGKLYLAFDPDAVGVPSDGMAAFTANTLKDTPALQAAVETAREQGWASNLEEWQSGLSVLAAPVLVNGRLVATVALALVSPRLEELGMQTLARRVVHAAESVALRLEGKTR